MFVRAGIALLCAHFEGFIRLAANFYVVYVSYKGINNKDVQNSFIALKLKYKFREFSKTEKSSVHKTIFDKLDEIQEETFFIRYSEDDRIIKTDSNPSSEVVAEIMKSISLDFSPFESKKNYIDFNLLKNRHQIVHGEKTSLSKQDFMDTFEIILEIIEEFKNTILMAAENELYLKAKSS